MIHLNWQERETVKTVECIHADAKNSLYIIN